MLLGLKNFFFVNLLDSSSSCSGSSLVKMFNKKSHKKDK